MACHAFDLGNGATAIVCTGRARRKLCKCGRPHTRLCDFELKGRKAGKTCDVALCDSCATRVGPNRDLCSAHAALSAKTPVQQALDPSLFREVG